MNPTLAALDTRDCGVSYAVLTSEDRPGLSCFKRGTDCNHITVRQPGVSMALATRHHIRRSASVVEVTCWPQTKSGSMDRVIGRRAIRKVRDTIIRFVAVEMIRNHAFRAWTDESSGDELMHTSNSFLRVLAQRQHYVSMPVNLRSHDEGIGTESSAANLAADTSTARDAVQAFVPDNRTPFFVINGGERNGKMVVNHWCNLLDRFAGGQSRRSANDTLAARSIIPHFSYSHAEMEVI